MKNTSITSPEPALADIEISVVVPVYNAEGCIAELTRRLHTVLSGLCSNYEILLIEDCSRDNSWAAIKTAATADARVHGVRLSRNFGQRYAISAGVDMARGNWLVVMDCDLQDPPELIASLYAKAKEGNPIVFARKAAEKTSFCDRATSRIFYYSLGLMSQIKVQEGLTNFSIISRQVADTIRQMRERLRFYGGMLFWTGFPYAIIDYSRDARHSGISSYNFWRRLRLAVRNIFAYSTMPLEYSAYVGLGVLSMAGLYILYVISQYFLHDAVPSGWTSLVLLISFFGGFLTFQLGMVGMYVGQIMEETRRRPLYVILEQTSARSEPAA